MKSLDLYVEYRVRIDLDLHILLDVFSKSDLVLSLGLCELCKEKAVLAVCVELAELLKVALPLCSDSPVDQPGERLIGLDQEPSVADSVGLVVESLRIQLEELPEYCLGQDIRVKSGYAVDRVASDN